LLVVTQGSRGGYFLVGGKRDRYQAEIPPGPPVDSYGCGDSFVAGLTFALAQGRTHSEAVLFAAKCGAACVAGGGLSAQLHEPLPVT
jgi:ribokinase